jgi:5-methylcytosine-specific restriction protein A
MRLCCAPGCGVVVRSGRCKQHETAKEQQRGTSRERGYTYRWSVYAKQWLQRRPVCGMRDDMSLDTINSRCAAAGMTTVARCVDHTVPISRGGSMFDPSNHMSACIACNSAKGDR